MNLNRNPRYLPQEGIVKINENTNNNVLRGVVTPQTQALRRDKINADMRNGILLESIINNKSLFDRFDKNTFPNFQVMNNGDIFFEGKTKVISTIHQYYVKWFSLDKSLNISHDHNYQFTRLIKDGYFMKISVPRLSDAINDFRIDYLVKVDNVETVVNSDISSRFSNNDFIELGKTDVMIIEPFDISKYPSIMELISDKDEFIKKYLIDILDEN